MMTTSSNTGYKDPYYLLTTLATIGAIATLATVDAQAATPFNVDTHDFNIQTSQNNFGNYESLKLTTQVENVVRHSQNEPLASFVKNAIVEKTSSMFGYDVLEIHESLLTDEEGTFKVFTLLLDIEERDYSKLLEQEWEISEALLLYEQNMILRFV